MFGKRVTHGSAGLNALGDPEPDRFFRLACRCGKQGQPLVNLFVVKHPRKEQGASGWPQWISLEVALRKGKPQTDLAANGLAGAREKGIPLHSCFNPTATSIRLP